MRYLIVPADCVEDLLVEAKNAGIVYPEARYSVDRSEAIITEPDGAYHEGALIEAEIRDFLSENSDWESVLDPQVFPPPDSEVG